MIDAFCVKSIVAIGGGVEDDMGLGVAVEDNAGSVDGVGDIIHRDSDAYIIGGPNIDDEIK